ncbi:hypothetical protein [Streptomyces sp. NPDC052721]|uniref:hypothetical protein n=1 Tax=Streptomyces sp. NPDC052721 TaxID=3154955 RepID=UPI003416BF85
MVTEILTAVGVVVALATPFLVEIYKGSRANDEQNHISGINAWAEEFVPPSAGCPPGYCHLKYVIRNASGNDIHQVAVVQPGRDKLNFIPVVHAGGPDYVEIDPGLRLVDPAFAGYPVEITFVDSKGRTWHKHRVSERVRPLLAHPRSIRDYESHKNPRGMKTVARQVLLAGVAIVITSALTYGMLNISGAAPGKEPPAKPTQKAGR